VAKPTRQSGTAQLRKTVKVTASIDASLYTRLAAGAAMKQVSHSRFVADALEAALKEMGLIVVRRRSAGDGDSPVTVDGIGTDAA
jgi:hypothetical protein